MPKDVSAMIIGGGGREDALFCAISVSPRIKKLIVAPGNGGIPADDRRNVSAGDVKNIVALAQEERIDLVVIGPEAPLVAGLADSLREREIRPFGPSASAAKLESSKIFTKKLCRAYDIPTAKFVVADTFEQADALIKKTGYKVIKADGLCGGKGVVVAKSKLDARQAAWEFLEDKIHHDAGARICIEEKLEGRECSMMFLCDGINAVPLPVARDFKRLGDGDTGPNTGGMGAYSPVPDVSSEDEQFVLRRMIHPTLRHMALNGMRFHGLLYAGIMLTKKGPMLIEYNVRFGDPETQVVLPRIESDIVPYLLATTEYGGLAGMPPLKVNDVAAVTVAKVSGGYPGKYRTGYPITGVDSAHLVYHAGTMTSPELRTDGGRVLYVTGLGSTIAEARAMVYRDVAKIHFENEHYRTDIAQGV